jgi:hypothetical protein
MSQISHRPFLESRIEAGEQEQANRQQNSRDEDVPDESVTGNSGDDARHKPE